jgi:hypothetical protein
MSEETAPLPQIKITWILGITVAFVIFAVIAAYSSRMTHDYTDFDQQRAQERAVTLKKLRDDSNATLTSADWVDQDKKIVRIPIDEAMAKELDTLKSQPAQVGREIPVVAPAPASTNAAPLAAAPATTNAAPAVATPPAPTPK